MISFSALSLLIWLATVAGALVPVVLVTLFILDYKNKTIW